MTLDRKPERFRQLVVVCSTKVWRRVLWPYDSLYQGLAPCRIPAVLQQVSFDYSSGIERLGVNVLGCLSIEVVASVRNDDIKRFCAQGQDHSDLVVAVRPFTKLSTHHYRE